MKKIKSFFASKLVWSGILVFLIGLQEFFDKFDFSQMTPKSYVTMVVGVLIILFRAFSSNPPLTDISATKLNAKINESKETSAP